MDFPQESPWLHPLMFRTPKYENQWKSLRFVWKKFPTGAPLGNSTVLWGSAPQDSFITIGISLVNLYSHKTAAFHCLSQISSIIWWKFVNLEFGNIYEN